MYSMAQQSSNVPYSGAKGMFRTIFGLDYLGDDAFAIKDTLLQVNSTHDTTLLAYVWSRFITDYPKLMARECRTSIVDPS